MLTTPDTREPAASVGILELHPPVGPDWAAAELARARLGDRRRIQSAIRVCQHLAAHPGWSFSAACGSAARQAGARLLAHPKSTVPHLLCGHFEQTAARCRAYPLVLVAQDTTALAYNGHLAATGLGPITDKATGRGFFAHTAYALAPDGTPLGLLHADFWARDPQAHGKTQHRREREPDEKESRKWRQGLEGVEAALPAEQPLLLIQDREGDVFAFMAAPRRANTHLLLRASQPRVVESLPVRVPAAAPDEPPERGTLFAVAAEGPVVGEMTVTVGRKPGQPEREATLAVRCRSLWVQPTKRKGVPQVPQRMWVILATERHSPENTEPVEWVLLTTLPVEDGATACLLVRYYARRWAIERLHFTLKSGLRVERLQLDDVASLMRAVALYYVVAWRLLYLTHVARTEPERPAAELLEADELTVLAQASGRPITTARQVVRAIARLGSFEDYPRAPEPGVKLLWQGLQRLQAMVAGWRLALGTLRDI